MHMPTKRNDVQMEAVFDISYSDIRHAKDEDALNVVRMLSKELEPIGDDLEDFFVEGADLQRLKDLADEFESSSQTQGQTIASSITAHKQLNILFRETQDLLKKTARPTHEAPW